MVWTLLLAEKWRKRVLYSLLSIPLLVPALYVGSAAAQLNPYQIKAVFLFNFSKFVSWPESAIGNTDFNICVLGKDPFGVYLDLTLEDTQAYNRPIRAKRVQTLDQLNDCQILFISVSEQGRLTKILALTRNQAILTVSDIPNFANDGGCIALRKTGRKVGLVINQTSIRQAGLKIRANLLQLSKII